MVRSTGPHGTGLYGPVFDERRTDPPLDRHGPIWDRYEFDHDPVQSDPRSWVGPRQIRPDGPFQTSNPNQQANNLFFW
jgi:hypothetical protein